MDAITTNGELNKARVEFLKDHYRIELSGNGDQAVIVLMTPDEFHKFVSACLETQEIEINQVIKKAEKLLEEVNDLKWNI